MAKVEVGSVKLDLSHAELELIKRALRLVQHYGEGSDEDPARNLLGDLEA